MNDKCYLEPIDPKQTVSKPFGFGADYESKMEAFLNQYITHTGNGKDIYCSGDSGKEVTEFWSVKITVPYGKYNGNIMEVKTMTVYDFMDMCLDDFCQPIEIFEVDGGVSLYKGNYCDCPEEYKDLEVCTWNTFRVIGDIMQGICFNVEL